MDRVRKAGADVAEVRLDVSYGTFAPVRVQRIEDHHMHPEAYQLPVETASAIKKNKARGGRVIAVGTTTVRTLEHSALKSGVVEPGKGTTSLFIYPGFAFQVVDAMITNFHMPRSTLIMLVSAFAGRELIMKAYEHALSSGYRFLSYGDAMLII
jgi:S-adenosylmethionine:tRNA ribosyltransferase-isomerase